MEDYSKLEGKVIEWISISGRLKQVGRVVNVEKDIGITIVDNKDTTDELSCLDGPYSKIWKKNKKNNRDSAYQKNYDKIFRKAISMIKAGKWYCEEIDKIYGADKWRMGHIQSCSFK